MPGVAGHASLALSLGLLAVLVVAGGSLANGYQPATGILDLFGTRWVLEALNDAAAPQHGAASLHQHREALERLQPAQLGGVAALLQMAAGRGRKRLRAGQGGAHPVLWKGRERDGIRAEGAPPRGPAQVGANALVVFLSFFSAFFSFIVLAGFFFSCFFWFMPLLTCISLAVRWYGCGCSRSSEYAPADGRGR